MPIIAPMRGEAYILWLRQQAQRRVEIKKLRRAGKSLAQIAQEYGISRARVHQIVNPKP